MTAVFKPAERRAISLLIGLAGGTGSGKTFSALRIASGLAGDRPFALVDTENGRALHYADEFPFDHAELAAPFTPQAYRDAIREADAAGYPVIVVDSASHEHAGDGGLLDMHDAELQRMGGRDSAKMAAWIAPKREHKKLVSELLALRAHLILCFRAEQKIEMRKDAQGRWEIVPKSSLVGLDGWIPIAEKNLPFELTVSFLLTADQPGIPHPIKLPDRLRPLVPLEQPLSEAVGASLGEWARGTSDSPAPSPDPSPAAPETLSRLAAIAGPLLDAGTISYEQLYARAGTDGERNWTAFAGSLSEPAAQSVLERLQQAFPATEVPA